MKCSPAKAGVHYNRAAMKQGWVYILTNGRNGTLYIGVTSNIAQRIWQHREGTIEGFTKRYGLKRFVWYGYFENLHDARRREGQMKGWKRAWKIELIETMNPDWRDLYFDLLR